MCVCIDCVQRKKVFVCIFYGTKLPNLYSLTFLPRLHTFNTFLYLGSVEAQPRLLARVCVKVTSGLQPSEVQPSALTDACDECFYSVVLARRQFRWNLFQRCSHHSGVQ